MAVVAGASASLADTPPPYLSSWGSIGLSDGQFERAYGLAVSPAGMIYVSDRFSPRVQQFTDSGTFVGKWGSVGSGSGQFGEWAYGLAVGPAGDVYASDGTGCRLERFSGAGAFISSWGTFGSAPGEF